MTTAILLAGPSLSRLDTAPEADLTIAVKRAGLRFGTPDWLVVLDSRDLQWARCTTSAAASPRER